MDKDVAQTYRRIPVGHKKEQRNNASFSNMDATRDYHTKSGKSERDKYYMVYY